MKYPPGSFSKNFAWHGTGLRKLYTVIQAGFQDTVAATQRQRFRDDSQLDASLSLIPVNFFLHNRAGQISVDELVFQALERQHTIRFDRLALFALHLNHAGSGQGVVARPAMWANEFVRERLWQDGFWHSSELLDGSIDAFIADRMDATPAVCEKCRNNYRHLFELCELWPTTMPLINSEAEEWIASALFLAWDRHILDGVSSNKATFLSLIDSSELYKLLGTTREFAAAQAGDLAELYISLRRIDRFSDSKSSPSFTASLPQELAPELSEEEGLEWLEQGESDAVVERRAAERQEQTRDRRKAAALKQHYFNTCQFCGIRLQVAQSRFYSEAAHIKGLGQPHNGPDKVSNMIVLCPNHHLQFDRGVLRLRKVGTEYRIESKRQGDPLHGQAIKLSHVLDDACVKHHYDWFASTRT